MAEVSTKKAGDIINSRWKIINPLTDDTGQGHTFVVQDLNGIVDGQCVVKVLSKLSDQALARFRTEINASLVVDHPNIIKVIDSRIAGPAPYLVTDFCVGGELKAQRIRKLSLLEKLQIFEQVCEGTAHAHDNDVIHRDLKPRNIFLKDKKYEIPVIGDFGICFFREEDNSTERVTEIKETVGSKDFRPPEADFGILDNIEPTFDVFSLGKLLYWFLANGEVPVRWHYDHQRFDLRKTFDIQAIHLVHDIFGKSIRENPNDRYANAGEMLLDVERLKEFVTDDARYLDCGIDQKCIFCRNGKYEFLTSPSIKGGRFNYNKSRFYGYDILMGDGHSLHDKQTNVSQYPGFLLARCNNCGNIQRFLLNYIQNDERKHVPDTAWKSIPEAEEY